MDILRTDFDAKFHTKVCCCCFGLKTGSTIIASLNIFAFLMETILLYSSDEMENDVEENSNAYVDTIHGKTDTGRVAKSLINILFMGLSGAMLWGNIKGDKKLMLPYVYVGLVGLILLAVLEFIAVLTLIIVGQFLSGCLVFFFISIIILLQLYYWEVVRCRVLELDQLEQPRSGYPQHDPELPAYEDVQGENTMNMAGQEKSPIAYPNEQMNY